MGHTAVVHRSIDLDAPADRVWDAVKTPAAFRLVTRGLVRVVGLRRRTAPWREGETISGVLVVFGVLPVSVHHLTVERIDDSSRELHSDERGGVVKTWRHLIRVTPLPDGRCRYEDRIEIDAGLLTPLVAALARQFYAMRQRRWRELALTMQPSARPRGVLIGS
jgi:ligand-binding SRPBCC domain-containing protein